MPGSVAFFFSLQSVVALIGGLMGRATSQTSSVLH